MRRIRFTPGQTLLLLLSVALLCGGFARWIDADGGRVLIHKIPVEITEAQFVKGKIYRPLSAQSLNQRPAVLLADAFSNDMESLSPIALELSRRGFVALTVDNFAQGESIETGDTTMAAIVENGVAFLKSQSFVRKDRIGVAAFSLNLETDTMAQALAAAISLLLVDPRGDPGLLDEISAADNQFVVYTNSAAPVGAVQRSWVTPIHPPFVNEVLNEFHETLAIPNDTPFWFSPRQQLGGLREGLLLIGLLAVLGLAVPLCQILTKQTTLQPQTTSQMALPLGVALLQVVLMSGMFFLLNDVLLRQKGAVTPSILMLYWLPIACVIPAIHTLRKRCTGQPISQPETGSRLLKNIGAALLIPLMLYAFVWLFSRVFMIEFRFILSGLRPLRAADGWRWLALAVAGAIFLSLIRQGTASAANPALPTFLCLGGPWVFSTGIAFALRGNPACGQGSLVISLFGLAIFTLSWLFQTKTQNRQAGILINSIILAWLILCSNITIFQ